MSWLSHVLFVAGIVLLVILVIVIKTMN